MDAKTLARPESRVMALIGNGAQSEFQALAFPHLVGITTLRVFDVDPAASAKLVANLQGSGLHITVCQSTAEAASGAGPIPDRHRRRKSNKACASAYRKLFGPSHCAQRMALVMVNLNTHTSAPRYETFAPDKAKSNGQFTTETARTQLKRLYPTFGD